MKNIQGFLQEISEIIPQERLYTDELRRLAWGTDASFYRLIPQIVVRSETEKEISELLRLANKYELPVTFRAAGTSLSGQSISDSVLIVAGKHWEQYRINEDGSRVTLQPGIIGSKVNDYLKSYGRKFGPDPASIKSAMVGGIVMNNASGMNCGIHANSDRMLRSVRLVLADGTRLDTADEVSRASFAATHTSLIAGIEAIRDEIRRNEPLRRRIQHKYAIKNVTGLNLLPFLRFDDPLEIIAHLMVGSEGTLAFMSEVTMDTLPNQPYKATAMLYFKTIRDACRAVVKLKALTSVEEAQIKADTSLGENERFIKAGEAALVQSAEMLDWKSLSSVEDPLYVQYVSEVGRSKAEGLTALLTETKAFSPEALQENIKAMTEALSEFDLYVPVSFTQDPEVYGKFWAIRSGIFPSVGGTREPGTTCLIEDVAFQVEDLPHATEELQQLIARHGYDDACIYGHALEGNYHFIINQYFNDDQEVARYERLMNDVKALVVDKYDGSLKAEHGTGRNMAPFVRQEWGEEAYDIMCRIKRLFDPKGLLNPGVIINEDPHCYLKNFKPLPMIFDELKEKILRGEELDEEERALVKVDKCIECGFCEVNCVTCGFSLSSRQRIVIQRELARLRQEGSDAKRLALLEKQYRYLGNETCAGDGLCSMSCPMGINVGDLTHYVRRQALPPESVGYRVGRLAARHLHGVKNGLRPVLWLADSAHAVLGTKAMTGIAKGLHYMGVPLWNPAMPKAFRVKPLSQSPEADKVVYFPSCINQAMGNAKHAPYKQSLVTEMTDLLQKAGYEVIYPENMDSLCCGTIWESKGMPDLANQKVHELEEALWKASQGGRYPVLCDQSPCLHRMRQHIRKMHLYEPVEFIWTYLKERLIFHPKNEAVAVHITCSMREMGLGGMLVDLAQLCTNKPVLVPDGVGCCAFAGDRGFTHPEVNAYALRKLRPQIEEAQISVGYSNSRTCEIGLTVNAGIPYVSIAYLVNECTTRKS